MKRIETLRYALYLQLLFRSTSFSFTIYYYLFFFSTKVESTHTKLSFISRGSQFPSFLFRVLSAHGSVSISALSHFCSKTRKGDVETTQSMIASREAPPGHQVSPQFRYFILQWLLYTWEVLCSAHIFRLLGIRALRLKIFILFSRLYYTIQFG